MVLPTVILPDPNGPVWCWRCVEREVSKPGEMCVRCARSEEEGQRYSASNERSTETHERTHEKKRTELLSDGDGKLDLVAYEKWLRLTGK